jgi:hypothetical protein
VRRVWGALAASFLIGGAAFAVDYRLNAEGGPGDLSERVVRAFEQWAAVEGGEVSFREDPDARAVVRYGDGTRFGPDTLSLTVQRTPEPETQVLLNPTAPNERALLHEVGLLLGLAPAPLTQSVMNPLIGAGADAEIAPADEAALRARVAFAPEDINQDGVVDFYDLASLAAAYSSRGVNLPEDITGDGVVDGADLERLRAAYVFGAPSEVPPEEAAAEGAGTDLPDPMTGGAMTGGAMMGEDMEVENLGEADAEAWNAEDMSTGGENTDDAAEGGL